jgi:hypothetical protein
MNTDSNKPRNPVASSDPSNATSGAPAEPVAIEHDLDDADAIEDVDDDESVLYGPPFEARSFGAELVWAKGESYVAKILRVRAGQLVKVSALRRRDMVLLLTGGRATLENVDPNHENVRIEMQPGVSFVIDPTQSYRLSAMTDVELFTVYTEAAP